MAAVNPQTQYLQYEKTWCKPLETNGMFKGFVMGFKTRVIYRYGENPLSGLQLYAQSLDDPTREVNFFIQYDPYFYVILDPTRQQKVEQLLTLLQAYGVVQAPANNQRRLAVAMSRHHLDDTRGIKRLEIVRRHIFKKHGNQFPKYDPVLKIVLHDPRDVKKYAEYLEQFAYNIEDDETFDNVDTNTALLLSVNEQDISTYNKFTQRVGLDLGIRVGKATAFMVKDGQVVRSRIGDPVLNEIKGITALPNVRQLSYDIETLVAPMREPSDNDPINMIGFSFLGKGYHLNNVEATMVELPDYYVAIDENIKDGDGNAEVRRMTKEEAEAFDTALRPPIPVHTINCENERQMLLIFKSLIVKFQPNYISGYNSDRFDWPHIYARSAVHNISWDDIFTKVYPDWRNKDVWILQRDGCMMCDAYFWMKRDSYLSKGFQGLKSASKILLHVNAMETDHSTQAREWVYIRNVLLNPDHPSNQDPEAAEAHRVEAYEKVLRFAAYNMSDVFITDIFIRESIMYFNLALAGLIPETVDEVSRNPRGEQCELKLMERMNGWGIAQAKFRGLINENVNPSEARQHGKVYVLYKEEIDESQKETLAADCVSYQEMQEHCKGCTNVACQNQWKANWKKDLSQQVIHYCARDSPEDEPEDQVCFFPLNNAVFPVTEGGEGFEGARVSCPAPGYYNEDIPMQFRINKPFMDSLLPKILAAYDKMVAKFEKKNTNVRRKDGTVVNFKIIDRDALRVSFQDQLNHIFDDLQPDPNGDPDWRIWNGKPLIVHVDVASMYPSIIINWNLNPYAVVYEDDCAACPYHWEQCHEEHQCWVNMDWTPNYEVIHIPTALKATVDRQIAALNTDPEHPLKYKEKIKMYDTAMKTMRGKKRVKLEYQMPETSRFCQKAMRFFADAVRSFRMERLKYKSGMQKAEKEAEFLEEKYKGQTMPHEIEAEVARLEAEAIFNRNMQLGLKVLLNSVHPDDRVIIRSPQGEISDPTIGELYTLLGNQNGHFDQDKHAVGVRAEGYAIWDGVAFQPLRGVIAHKFTDAMYHIVTRQGFNTRVTAGHSIMVLDRKMNFAEVRGDSLASGMYVITPKAPVDIQPFLPIVDDDYLPQSIIACVPELAKVTACTVAEALVKLAEAQSYEGKQLYAILCEGYRFDEITSIDIIEAPKFVYDASVNTDRQVYIVNGILEHNTYYGYLGGPGARFKSYEVTGATCTKGQEIINYAIDFCRNFAVNIEVDTDGLWSVLPAFVPVKIPVRYHLERVDTHELLLDTEGKPIVEKADVAVFGEVLNHEVTAQFTNMSNYVPCAADGNIYTVSGELWSEKMDPNNPENAPFDYERDDAWNADRHWKCMPQCLIEFEFEGPYYAAYFARKKKYKIWKKNKQGQVVVETITGLDEKRKDGYAVNRRLSIELTAEMSKARVLEDAWKNPCINVGNVYLAQAENHTLDLSLIVESKDLTESAAEVRNAFEKIQNLFQELKLNPDTFHVYEHFIDTKFAASPETRARWLGTRDRPGALDGVKSSKFLMAGLRAMDMGLPIDTVEYFVSRFPTWVSTSKRGRVEQKEKVSQRVVPIRLFDGSPEQIKQYAKRWFGIDDAPTDIREWIDWNEYKESMIQTIRRYIVYPARRQGFNVYQWLNVPDPSTVANDVASKNHSLLDLMKKASAESKPSDGTKAPPITPAPAPKPKLTPLELAMRKNPLDALTKKK